jgi:hypothetical protein
MARSGGAGAAAVITVTVLLKTAGALLALAMVMPWGQRLPRRALFMAGLAGSALLILYGVVEVAGEALAETGAIRPSAPDLDSASLASSAVGSLVSCLGLAAGGRHLGIPAIRPAGQELSRLTAPALAPARHRYRYRRTYAGPSPDATIISNAQTNRRMPEAADMYCQRPRSADARRRTDLDDLRARRVSRHFRLCRWACARSAPVVPGACPPQRR